MKNIAPGFQRDAEKLLEDFANKNSIEFSIFSTIWRKHHFSLIFMGRTDENELYEFTYEVFRISLQFLSSVSFPNKVGAIYFMYALYRNQKLEPCVKIRIELWQWKIINDVYQEATKNKYRSVQYVIEYLAKNGFSFVGKHTLMGPLIDYVQNSSKITETLPTLKAKSEFTEYSTTNNIQALSELQKDYLEIKKELDGHIKVNPSGSSGNFEQITGHMNDMLNNAERCTRSRKQRELNKGNSIGLRRNKIKAAAFSTKPVDFWGRKNESDDSDIDDPIQRVTYSRGWHHNKRVPKTERRIGRPGRKVKKSEQKPLKNEPSMDFTDNIEHLLEQQHDLFIPPDLKKRSVRFPYYEVSPKQ